MPAANPATTPSEWDELLTTTMHNSRKTLTDNVFNSHPLLHHFMSNGRIETVDGGISIVEPIIYGEGDAGSYGQWDQISVVPKQGISAAQFPWALAYATVAISGLEEAQNNGKSQQINLLEAKIMQAEQTLKSRFAKMAYGTQAGGVTADDFIPITTLIDDTAAVGGINPATGGNEFWKSYVDAAVGVVSATAFESALRVAFNTASDAGTDKVDAIFAAQAAYEFYESTLTPGVRYTDAAKANLGFTNLMFKSAPMYWDPEAPEGLILGVNSKYIGMKVHSDRNFKQSPFTANLSGSVASTNSAGPGAASANALDARVSFITTFGNFTTRQRRRHFKLTGVNVAP